MHFAGVVWLIALWAAVALTPPLRLPNGIPLRFEDLLVCGAGMLLLSAACYRGRVRRLPAAAWPLVAMTLYILLVTFFGPPIAELSVGAKEFADAARPAKFLVVLLTVSRLPYPMCRRALLRVVPAVTYILLGLSLAQFILLTPESSNALADLSLSFSELPEWHIRSFFFGNRPFGAFATPTDLGYYAALAFVVALTLKDMPRRALVLVASVLTLVLSNTRTFVFAIPLLLMVYAWFSARSVRRKVAALFAGVLWIGVGAGILVGALPLLSSHYTPVTAQTLSAVASGEFQQDQSISQRLSNLYLVEIALERAPWTGIVSRDLFPVAFDSEYIMVLHRYGIIGLALTFIFYFVVTWHVWRNRCLLPDVAWLVLWAAVLTFLYGITQGALINTRMGSFVFVILGLWVAGLRSVPRAT